MGTMLAIAACGDDFRRVEAALNANHAALSQLQNTGASLTQDEAEICASLGISHAQFLANKAGAAPAALSNAQRPAVSGGYGAGNLTEEEAAVCRSLGVSAANFLAAKNGTPAAALSNTQRPSNHYTATLSAYEMDVCRMLGISKESFLAAREACHA